MSLARIDCDDERVLFIDPAHIVGYAVSPSLTFDESTSSYHTAAPVWTVELFSTMRALPICQRPTRKKALREVERIIEQVGAAQ